MDYGNHNKHSNGAHHAYRVRNVMRGSFRRREHIGCEGRSDSYTSTRAFTSAGSSARMCGRRGTVTSRGLRRRHGGPERGQPAWRPPPWEGTSRYHRCWDNCGAKASTAQECEARVSDEDCAWLQRLDEEASKVRHLHCRRPEKAEWFPVGSSQRRAHPLTRFRAAGARRRHSAHLADS